jgi:hypothetical protein
MGSQIPDIRFQIFDNTSNNVQGEIDVASATTFPIALTFTIKDIQDITKSKGSFSKNFKVPATRNNNEIFKSIFSDSFYDSFAYIDDKTARIFVDGSLVLQGKFKVKATIQDNIPKEYECVVFGENYEWVNLMEDKNLCDIDFDAGNLFPDTPNIVEYEKEDIEFTWNIQQSGDLHGGVGSHIVYPLVNTGKWLHGNFVHMDDLFPAIFIRDIVLCSFAGIGYQVESAFMNSDWFKKLITLSPRQIFEISEDASVATPYSWEYATDPDNPASGWKIPINYRNNSQPPNNFDGGVGFLPTPSCSGCDPNGIWSAGNTLTNVEMMFYGAYLDEMDHKSNISGWYWGQYGQNAPSQNYEGVAFNKLQESFCNSPTWAIFGSEWNCVWTDPVTYVEIPTPAPNTFHSEAINNVSVMQTPQTGTYSFNIKMELEMDNDYVIDNEPMQFDPYGNPAIMAQYRNKGFMYAEAQGMSYGGTDPSTGLDEWEDFGCMYCASVFLVQIDASSGKHKPMVLDRTCATNYDDLLWHGFWTEWRPDGNLPAANLKFNLEATNFLFDILDTNDQFYFYCEVNENFMSFYDTGFSSGTTYHSFTQCKYRINDAVTFGGLTDAMTDGGQVSISSLMPCDVSQLEWINGLTGLFNLYWYADEGAKKIYVEPRDNFFANTSQAVDWSEKIDMSQKSRSEFVYDTLNRDLCFTYEDDGSDGFVEERNNRVGQKCSLNSYAMDLGNLYKNKDTQIGSDFYAPTYMFNDMVIGNNQDKSPFIPVIHSEYTQIWTTTANNDYPDKVEDFAPRILLWGGLVPVYQADGAVNGNRWRWGKTNPSDTPELKKYYPFAGTFNNQNEDFFGSLSVGATSYFPTLPFQDAEANDMNPAAAPPLYPFCDGLFKVFWEKNINGLLERPRIKRAWLKLTAKDIMDFDFRRLVYLDAEVGEGATYWIVNKIIDYQPAKNQMTKVELYQWNVHKPRKSSKGKRKEFVKSNLGQSRDVPNGKNYQFNIRLENNADDLGVSGVDLLATSQSPNINLNLPTLSNNLGWQEYETAYPTRTPINPTDGSLKPRSNNDLPSFSIGSGNEVLKGSGSIVIGNNTKTNVKNSGIKIGKNVSDIRRNPEQIICQGANQKNPAFVINQDGRFLEGGGGGVVYQDASGNYQEVWVEIGTFDKNFVKLLKNR